MALAGGLAASIAGRIARWIITAIIVLASAGIVARGRHRPGLTRWRRPGFHRRRHRRHRQPGRRWHVTAFPVLAVVAGCLLALAGLLVLPPAGRHWNARTKYDARLRAERQSGHGPVDEIDSWDRLSRGDDPT